KQPARPNLCWRSPTCIARWARPSPSSNDLPQTRREAAGLERAAMAAEIFIQRFPVEASDIDELGHVNNTVYLRWAQDIATAHWRARATAEAVSAFVWVVLRHEVDYR